MEKPIRRKIVKKVVLSKYFIDRLDEVLDYGAEQFGYAVALKFYLEIEKRVQNLSVFYEANPENPFIKTKSKIYRNIIIGKYCILYKICIDRIEVLTIYHQSINPRKIKEMQRW